MNFLEQEPMQERIDNTRTIATVGGYTKQTYPDPKFCLETTDSKVLKALEKLKTDHGSDYRNR